MRWAQSYSILDHQLLHGGHLARLSHEALVLYLFLAVVSDREGRSYWGDDRVRALLRLSDEQLVSARSELQGATLITYQSPYTYLHNLRKAHG